jgi:hypothetical protein
LKVWVAANEGSAAAHATPKTSALDANKENVQCLGFIVIMTAPMYDRNYFINPSITLAYTENHTATNRTVTE